MEGSFSSAFRWQDRMLNHAGNIATCNLHAIACSVRQRCVPHRIRVGFAWAFRKVIRCLCQQTSEPRNHAVFHPRQPTRWLAFRRSNLLERQRSPKSLQLATYAASDDEVFAATHFIHNAQTPELKRNRVHHCQTRTQQRSQEATSRRCCHSLLWAPSSLFLHQTLGQRISRSSRGLPMSSRQQPQALEPEPPSIRPDSDAALPRWIHATHLESSRQAHPDGLHL